MISTETEGTSMRIAIPVTGGRLATHFGHCEQFALVDVDQGQKTILATEVIDAPPHQPGLLPGWLAKRGAAIVIAGGMGQKAQWHFAQNGITVVVGATSASPEQVVTDYLNGTLQSGVNLCDH
jgi:predicted Fe-Mo cluster-binding NifX family protein